MSAIKLALVTIEMINNFVSCLESAHVHSKVQTDSNSQDSIILDLRRNVEPIISTANPDKCPLAIRKHIINFYVNADYNQLRVNDLPDTRVEILT